MIELDDVSKIYALGKDRTVPAVQGVTLRVERGEFLVITGRSGSGKTTLLNLVAGLAQPTAGRVLLDGVEIWKLPDAELSRLRNKKIGFVFQFPSLMPSLTALENVLLPTLFAAAKGDAKTQAETRQRAVQLLGEVGLSDKLEAYPRQLSAGQQQRVVIARSLINRPDLLLADEPTSDLDEQTEQEIMAAFQDIHNRTGITILLVTHSTQLISFGTRALRMQSGQIMAADG
ncbi:MAG: ABC transporter ATP-binding protein [Anaerolineae bacterium]|nr:ABC transporter ATP-binding protein [Anaerolineae bacterium]